MDDRSQHHLAPWRRGLRAAPFAAVALCFLLPFFTVSGCEGPETTVSGAQIVAGTRLANPQNTMPSADTDSEAQGVSDNVRPWAIALLLVAIAGGLVMAGLRRHLLPAGITLSGLAVVAVAEVWRALSGELPDGGLLLATLVIALTALGYVLALALEMLRSVHRRVHPEQNQPAP